MDNEEITSIDLYDGNHEGDLISRQAVLDEMDKRHAEGDSITKGFIKALPSVEIKGEWIPVSERLPEGRTTVLACDRMHDIFVAWFEDNNWTSSDKVFVKGCPILAWQPLPEPYKEGGAK